MKPRVVRTMLRVTAPVALLLLTGAPADAQYDWRDLAGEQAWENARFRVSHVTVDPGSTLAPGEGLGRVMVYLTAGPEGLALPEAVWQAEAGDIRNEGSRPFEALAIEVKDVALAASEGTPPETLVDTPEMQVTTLVDDPRVLVTRHRYAPNTMYAPLHFHEEDVVVVYLRGGYTWPMDGTWGGAWTSRVRRGDVDVIPANTYHAIGNAGGDPIEFLMIFPR